jgi:Spy/CpxP family protein refolding chaperone
MPRKISLLFAVTLLFTTTACDSTEEPVEDRAAELPDANPDDVGAKRDHHGKHGKHNPAEKLCSELECSDAQIAKIDELFASRHEGRDSSGKAAHEARKAARGEAHKAIADAFRADEFDASVLDRVAPDHEQDGHDGGDREAKMIAFATELHAILTPEQRAKLADKIEAGHPMLFHHGKKGHHGKMGKHGKHGEKGFAEQHDGDHKADRLADKVDQFCEPITCTAEQKTQLSSTFTAVHEAHRDARTEHEADKPDFKPLADAIRAETLDEGQLRAALSEGGVHKQERKGDHLEAMGATLAEIHAILTPEQRAIVAGKIEAEGLHALMGKRHHGKKGKHKRGGPEAVDAE